jgi:hypothetical protein
MGIQWDIGNNGGILSGISKHNQVLNKTMVV